MQTYSGISKTSLLKGLLLFILLIAAMVRLWRINEYMTFLGDEGRDARVVWRLLYDHDLVFIGPMTSVTTREGHMFLGPAYYYLVAPGMWLMGGSPVGLAVVVALLSVLTVYFIYDVGKAWFGAAVGLVAAGLYAISPTVIIYSRSSWNPNVMPLFAIMAIWSAYKLRESRKWSWLLVWTVAINMALQSHYLGLLLIPGTGIWLLLAAWKDVREKRFSFMGWVAMALFLTLLFFVPLILFDIKHGGMNAKAIMAFFTNREQTVNLKFYNKFGLVPELATQIFTRLLFLDIRQTVIPPLVLVGTLLASAYWMWQEKKERAALWALWIWFGVGVIGLSSYKQHIYDHYFGFLFPAPFLLVAWMMVTFWRAGRDCKLCGIMKRGWVSVALLAILITMYEKQPWLQQPNRQYQKVQENVETILRKANNEAFNFGLIAKQNYDEGYRFVFESHQAKLVPLDPARPETVTQQLFVVCENPDLANSPEDEKCKPVGHPQAEIAGFGWAQIQDQWQMDWGHKIYKLNHYREF